MHCPQEMMIQQLLLDQWTRTETVRFRRGAGALIEEYEHAIARGATIYCEIGGGGMSADAYTYYASIGAKK
jgi:threonine dehydratase